MLMDNQKSQRLRGRHTTRMFSQNDNEGTRAVVRSKRVQYEIREIKCVSFVYRNHEVITHMNTFPAQNPPVEIH